MVYQLVFSFQEGGRDFVAPVPRVMPGGVAPGVFERGQAHYVFVGDPKHGPFLLPPITDGVWAPCDHARRVSIISIHGNGENRWGVPAYREDEWRYIARQSGVKLGVYADGMAYGAD